MVMVERVHITKEMGYHEGIRDTSPYVVVKAKKKSMAGATKYNSHDPHKTTCAYSRGNVAAFERSYILLPFGGTQIFLRVSPSHY